MEKEIVTAENARVASGVNPLEIFPTLSEDIGLLLEGALVAVRHAAASGEAEPGELAEAAALDQQLSSLLTVHAKEPLFFWHGPKWGILSKLRVLLGVAGGAGEGRLRERLEKAAAESSDLSGEDGAALAELVGTSTAPSDAVAEAAKGPVPVVGVVADDAACGPCDLAAPLQAAAAASSGGVAHLLVLPSSEQSLRKIGTVISSEAGLPALYVSLELAVEIAEQGGQQGVEPRLKKALTVALAALRRQKVDLLWLPYKLFTKKVWESVQRFLQEAIGAGSIGAYGVSAEARTATLVRKLLDRKPAPTAWMAPHGLLRPVEPEAAAAARELGVVTVALSRVAGVPGGGAGAYLEAVVGRDAGAQEAAMHRWTMQRGTAVAVRLAKAPQQQEEALRKLPGARLSASGEKLLSSLRLFSRPEKPKTSESLDAGMQAEGAPLPPLEWAASLGRLEAQRAVEASPRRGMPAPGGPSTGGVTPTVSSGTLEGMPEQKKTYKENNHVIYKEDFFDEATFAAMKVEVERLWRSRDLEPNCNLDGLNRLGGYVLDLQPQDTSLYRLIYGNEAFRRWVSEVNDEGEMWPSDFPIEVREYGLGSKGMGCHPDLQMYAVEKKDLEFAFTIENESKCNVTFWDKAGKQHKVKTRANSMMMVRVNAATHCVSPTVEGTRTIVKFIFVGDYRKSKDFWHYTDNHCEADNPNVAALRVRREAGRGVEL